MSQTTTDMLRRLSPQTLLRYDVHFATTKTSYAGTRDRLLSTSRIFLTNANMSPILGHRHSHRSQSAHPEATTRSRMCNLNRGCPSHPHLLPSQWDHERSPHIRALRHGISSCGRNMLLPSAIHDRGYHQSGDGIPRIPSI